MNQLRTQALPPEHEILSRVFNTPDKKKRLAHEVYGCEVQHIHKILRGEVRSDLGRVCAAINLAATFPDESWEPAGASLYRAGILADYVREFYILILEMEAAPYAGEHDRVVSAMDILRESQQAIEALALGKPASETLPKLVQLRDVCEMAITRLSKAEPQA